MRAGWGDDFKETAGEERTGLELCLRGDAGRVSPGQWEEEGEGWEPIKKLQWE